MLEIEQIIKVLVPNQEIRIIDRNNNKEVYLGILSKLPYTFLWEEVDTIKPNGKEIVIELIENDIPF